MLVDKVTKGRNAKRAHKVTGDVVLNIFRHTVFGVPGAVFVTLSLCAAKIIIVHKPERFSIIRLFTVLQLTPMCL